MSCALLGAAASSTTLARCFTAEKAAETAWTATFQQAVNLVNLHTGQWYNTIHICVPNS